MSIEKKTVYSCLSGIMAAYITCKHRVTGKFVAEIVSLIMLKMRTVELEVKRWGTKKWSK